MGSSPQNQRAGQSLASAIATTLAAWIINPTLGAATTIATIARAAAIFALTFASTFVALNLNKVRRPTLDTSSSRTITIVRPIVTRRVVYGVARVGGILTFYHPEDEPLLTDNTIIPSWMVITLCDGPVEDITTVWIDGVPIPADHIDGNGDVIDGPFTRETTANPGGSTTPVRIWKHLGEEDQAADSTLFFNTPVPDSFRGQGIAYLVIWINNDPELFRSSIPNISATIKGKKVIDPRTLGVIDAAPAFSQNPVVALYDYLTSSRYGLGLKDDRLDHAWFESEANVCDEYVATAQVASSITAADPAAGHLVTSDIVSPFFYGDQVQVVFRGAGDLYFNDYALIDGNIHYADVVREGPDEQWIRLAASPADLAAGNFRTIKTSSLPTSRELLILKTAEPRYSISGVVDTADTPKNIVQRIADAMAGGVVVSGGIWRPIAGRYIAPSLGVEQDGLHGPIETSTKVTRTARANVIEGVYLTHLYDSQPNDYPRVLDGAAVTADGGDEIRGQLDLPLVSRPSQAQRVANIHLQRLRHEITATIRVPLQAALVQAGDVIRLSHGQWGWADKEFEVQEWSVTQVGDEQESPILAVELSLREYSSAIFTWSTDDEQVAVPGPPVGSGLSDYVDYPEGFTATAQGGEFNQTGVAFSWTSLAGFNSTSFIVVVDHKGDPRTYYLSGTGLAQSIGDTHADRTIRYRIKVGGGGYTEWRSITLKGDDPDDFSNIPDD